jgi:hypothetical protein
MLTTNQKGAIAEARITAAAIAVGIEVYRPAMEGGRYDMIFGADEQLIRVQCKWAPLQKGVVIIRGYSCRRAADGFLKRAYTADEIDAFAAYCAELDTCYLIPVKAVGGSPQISLRVGPPRNNQRLRVRWAKDFEFGASMQLASLGPIAQLGERMHGMHEVVGSSPTGSISSLSC